MMSLKVIYMRKHNRILDNKTFGEDRSLIVCIKVILVCNPCRNSDSEKLIIIV